MKIRSRRRLEGASSLGVLAFALWVVHREVTVYTGAEIRADLAEVSIMPLLVAAGLTVLNYVVLVGYDLISVRYADVRQPLRRVAFAATLGYSLSQALGFPLLTGGPVRLRLYGKWGVDGAKIATVIAFSSLTFWVGVCLVCGLLFTLAPPGWVAGIHVAAPRTFGALLLAVLAAYLGWVVVGKHPLKLGSFVLPSPSFRLVCAQFLVATLDWAVAAAVFFALMPTGHDVPFLTFAAIFVAAQVLGTLSNVPGGLGVFEATVLTLMPASIPETALLASFVAYRVVYYLLPLVAATVTLAGVEVWHRRTHAERAVTAVGSALPTVLAAGVFMIGALLLLWGAVPLGGARIAEWIHPAVLNISHFLSSLVGAIMIVVARGLQRRLRGAFHVTLVALVLVTALSVVAFAAPVRGIALASMAVILWVSRKSFYRRSSLLDQAFTGRWVVAILATIAITTWLGFFSLRNVVYSSDLWWRFTMNADAPRFLRASVGVAAVFLLTVIARLLRATPHVSTRPDDSALDAIRPIIAESSRANTNLAFLGDKSIMLSDSGRSFLMYGIQGSSWIALGDPVGDPTEYEALLWRFRDEADRAGDSIVVYQAAPENLHLYIDMGMGLFKLGQEGRVALEGLTLEGKRWSDLRNALRKMEKAGVVFSVLPREAVVDHLAELRTISDEWLTTKSVAEKGFSLGNFDPAFLTRTPLAVARHENQILAFANVFAGDARDELTIDLMRYRNDAPKGVMDFMFANLLLWGRDEGFGYFNLGMAPLAGLTDHRLAPLWHKLADTVFDHGERFYNFQGLFAFKDKFEPEWRPRYVGVQSVRHLPVALTDITTLIGGGFRGVLAR